MFKALVTRGRNASDGHTRPAVVMRFVSAAGTAASVGSGCGQRRVPQVLRHPDGEEEGLPGNNPDVSYYKFYLEKQKKDFSVERIPTNETT